MGQPKKAVRLMILWEAATERLENDPNKQTSGVYLRLFVGFCLIPPLAYLIGIGVALLSTTRLVTGNQWTVGRIKQACTSFTPLSTKKGR
jgi:hypothetical protein